MQSHQQLNKQNTKDPLALSATDTRSLEAMDRAHGLLDLPPELLDLVFEFCKQQGSIKGQASLAALRNTCRSLRAAVTPVLLGSLYLASTAGLCALIMYLLEHPGDTEFVHDLTLGRRTCWAEQGNTKKGNTVWVEAPGRTGHLLLAAHHFRHLKTLELREYNWWHFREDDIPLVHRIDPAVSLPCLENCTFRKLLQCFVFDCLAQLCTLTLVTTCPWKRFCPFGVHRGSRFV